MTESVISEFLKRMVNAFVPEKAAGVEAVIQLKFTGADTSDWYFTIAEGKCSCVEGLAPNAKLTVSVDSGDFIKIFTGQMDGMQAFMQGKLRLTGDMNLAMKLMNLFKVQG
jgi:putative sterol carrier protein